MSSDAPVVDDSARKPGIAYNPNRLFLGSCFALISTAITFAVIGDIMGTLKDKFGLNNAQAGYIGGAALWGFPVSIMILGPLCDALGMGTLMTLAFLCHAVGVILMISAAQFTGNSAYWALFLGAWIISLGNGAVEAACNPLIATIYPDRKTKKLNQFHMWFPGGIVIGGLIAFGITKLAAVVPAIGEPSWQIKLSVILLPTIIYGFVFFRQKFPHTERVQSGVSFGGMFKECLTRPLFLVLLVCMMITASLELGPGRWIPAVLQSGGMPGILVLCYINGIMAILRFFAGPMVHKFSNTGVLLTGAVLAGVGLMGLSYSSTLQLALFSATVFALGVCYFWPTMLGTIAERVPNGGALALALMGAAGMLAVGLVTAPQMGVVADDYVHADIMDQRAQVGLQLQQVVATYPAWAAAEKDPVIQQKIADAVEDAKSVRALWKAQQEWPKGDKPTNDTASALRAAASVDGPALRSDPRFSAAAAAHDTIGGIINPADNHGGLMSFRYLAPFAGVLVLVFGFLYLRDRGSGVHKIHSQEPQAGSQT